MPRSAAFRAAPVSVSRRRLRVIAGGAALVALAAALSACTTTGFSDETDAVSKAAAGLKAGVPSQEATANAAATKAVLIEQLATGRRSNLSASCGDDANTWRNSIVSAANADAEDAAYKTLSQVGLCPSVARGPGPASDDPSSKAMGALNDYFDGILAIVAAKDSNAVATAATGLSTSLGKLAGAAHASAPVQAAPGFFAKLAGMALAQAQYEALRDAVLRADPVIEAASPTLVRALRIEQARQIAEVAADARTAATAVDGTLNAPGVLDSPDRRLAYYNQFSPILDQLAAAQNASRADPAANVRAVVSAHHKLQQAIRANKGQAMAVINNAEGLASAAQGVLAPAAK